jgi:hypothetical protein
MEVLLVAFPLLVAVKNHRTMGIHGFFFYHEA